MSQHSAQTHGKVEAGTDSGPGKPKPGLKARAIDEGKKFLIMTLYLWVLLAVLNLHKTAILQQNHIDYEAQGFAIINALVLAKIMLIADDLKLGARFKDKPLIYGVLYTSFVFSIILIIFHIAEEAIVAVLHGRPVSGSLADFGAGNLRGVLSYAAIAFVTLIPFFLFRGIARVIGEDEILRLVFTREGAHSNQRSRSDAGSTRIGSDIGRQG